MEYLMERPAARAHPQRRGRVSSDLFDRFLVEPACVVKGHGIAGADERDRAAWQREPKTKQCEQSFIERWYGRGRKAERIHEHEGANALGPRQRGEHRHHAAERVADDVRRLELQRVGKTEDGGGEGGRFERHCPCRLTPIVGQVERDRSVLPGKRRNRPPPRRGRVAEAVQQHERETAAGLKIMKLAAVYRDRTLCDARFNHHPWVRCRKKRALWLAGLDLFYGHIAARGCDCDLRPPAVDGNGQDVLLRSSRQRSRQKIRDAPRGALRIDLCGHAWQELKMYGSLTRGELIRARTDLCKPPGDRAALALHIGLLGRAAVDRDETAGGHEVHVTSNACEGDVAGGGPDQPPAVDVFEAHIACGLNDEGTAQPLDLDIALLGVDEDRPHVVRYADRHVTARIFDMHAFAAI